MKIISNKLNEKHSFYGFRKAFIKNSEISLEARFLTVLLFCYKGGNLSCWPSMGELSKKVGKNKDTVRKYLKELEVKSYLIIQSRGIGRAHLYTPSYTKISTGTSEKEGMPEKPAEEMLHQPDEITLKGSISSGNIDKTLKTGKELFEQRRKELGF